MKAFDEFLKSAYVLREEEMRDVKAGEMYYYRVTCEDGKEYRGSVEASDDYDAARVKFGEVVSNLCGGSSSSGHGHNAIFC